VTKNLRGPRARDHGASDDLFNLFVSIARGDSLRSRPLLARAVKLDADPVFEHVQAILVLGLVEILAPLMLADGEPVINVGLRRAYS